MGIRALSKPLYIFLSTAYSLVNQRGVARITEGNVVPIINNGQNVVALEATVLQMSTMIEMLKSKVKHQQTLDFPTKYTFENLQ